ncbi:MAG TPA: energy transducer TonB [Pyrinomonadaceae bacterium]|jgi:TonB family protein
MKIITTLFLTFILSLVAAAQETEKWTKIASPKGDFTAQIPPNFLVDNEDDAFRVYAFDNQAKMTVEIEEKSDAKSRVMMMRQFPPEKGVRASQFEMGNFSGNVFQHEKDKGILMTIYMASSKSFISVFARANEPKEASVLNFLYSIRLNNQPLFKNARTDNQAAENAISLASLKTSPIVLSMLKIKDADKAPVKYALEDAKKDEEEDLNKYSRPFFTLRNPRASYTDRGRENGVNGSVRLKVLFRADGQIGEITVLQKLPDGLTEQALNAARKIKFVPAEIDGKPVDITKAVEYTFTLY